jgi:hypothetical protein
VIVSNNYGLKTSGKVRLTIVRDIVRPTIVISNPVVNIRTNSLVIDGLASDNAQVTNVMYWITNINAGLIPATNVQSGYATLSTNGNTNFNSGPNRMLWSITNMPLPGTNILAVQSVDYSSNVSAVVTRRFFYKVPATLMLSNLNVTGSGTLVGRAFIHNDPAPSNQASLNIGEGYSITAVPNSASLLSDWTNTWGTTNVLVTNGNTLKFVMESNTIITASFVSNLFVGIHGAYNGLFYVSPQLVTNIVVTNQVVIPASGTNVATTTNVVSTNSVYTNEVAFASAGMLNNLVLSKPGTFSGRLLLAGGNYGLSGTFNAFGHFSNSVPRPAALGGPLIVELNADTNGVGIITGTVSNAGWETNATLKATLATATPGSTNYTLVVLPMNNAPTNMASPPGYGYALIAEHGGTATLGGHLADGTAFSQTVPMSPSNQVPIYVSLYGRTGFLFGWASLTNTGGTNVQSGLTWIKGTPAHPTALYPDGFTNMLLSASSIWTNPGAITLQPSSVLAVSNADLDLNYAAGIEDNDKLVNTAGTPANSLSGTINLKTGFLQVIFGNGDGNATTRGYGAMLQSTTNAGGYFVTKTNAGSITLGLTNEPPVGSSTPVSDLETNSSNVGPYQYIGVGLESFSLERFK